MGKVLSLFTNIQKETEPQKQGQKYHCCYCNIPIELWEPLKTYNSERCCEVFDDFYNIIEELEKTPKYNYDTILNGCKWFKDKYPDIPDIEATIKELIEIELDLGVMTKKYKPLSLVNVVII